MRVQRVARRAAMLGLAWAILVAVANTAPVLAYSGGGLIPESAAASGCACHAGGQDRATVRLDEVPQRFTPGAVYPMKVVVTGPAATGTLLQPEPAHQGGFMVRASAGTFVKTGGKTLPREGAPIITHDGEGAHDREWTFSWRAPTERAPVEFSVAGLAANGDGKNANDAWKTLRTSSEAEPPPPTTPAPSPTKESPGPTPLLALASTLGLAWAARRRARP